MRILGADPPNHSDGENPINLQTEVRFGASNQGQNHSCIDKQLTELSENRGDETRLEGGIVAVNAYSRRRIGFTVDRRSMLPVA